MLNKVTSYCLLFVTWLLEPGWGITLDVHAYLALMSRDDYHFSDLILKLFIFIQVHSPVAAVVHPAIFSAVPVAVEVATIVLPLS